VPQFADRTLGVLMNVFVVMEGEDGEGGEKSDEHDHRREA